MQPDDLISLVFYSLYRSFAHTLIGKAMYESVLVDFAFAGFFLVNVFIVL